MLMSCRLRTMNKCKGDPCFNSFIPLETFFRYWLRPERWSHGVQVQGSKEDTPDETKIGVPQERTHGCNCTWTKTHFLSMLSFAQWWPTQYYDDNCVEFFLVVKIRGSEVQASIHNTSSTLVVLFYINSNVQMNTLDMWCNCVNVWT